MGLGHILRLCWCPSRWGKGSRTRGGSFVHARASQHEVPWGRSTGAGFADRLCCCLPTSTAWRPCPGGPWLPPITVWVLTVLSSLCRLQVHMPPAVPQPHPAGLPPARPRAALTREHPRASLQPGTPGSPWWWSPCGAQPHLSETCFLLPKGLTGEVLSQAEKLPELGLMCMARDRVGHGQLSLLSLT